MMTGSRTRAKVLEYFALNPGARPYLRWLTAWLGVAAPPLRRELERLRTLGFLRRSRDGRRVRYAVQLRRPGFRELQRLVLQTRVVAPLTASLPVEEIRVFGSYARGEAGPDSDLDLCVVAPLKARRLQRRLQVREVLGDIPCPLDVKVYTPEEFRKWKAHPGSFAYEVARNSLPIFVRDAGQQAAG